MASVRIWAVVAGLATAAFAGWDFVPEASWDSYGSARTRALGSPWWTDTTHFGLWALDANPAGLVGIESTPLAVNLSSSGTSLSGGGGIISHSEPIHLDLSSGKADGYAFQAHLIDVSETWRDTLGKPKYELSRLRWGFDAAVATGANRAFVIGFGFDGRIPSSQTQDTSGTGASGTFEHVQYALESARLGITSRIMESVTLGLQASVRADYDSLRYTATVGGTTSNPQLRFIRIDLPEVGFGVSVDRAQWPVQATVLFDCARGYRTGVLEDETQNVNVDLPQLVNDSLRFALAIQGRPDRRFPDQVIRPSFAIHWTNSSTQAYEPAVGTSNPLDGGAKLPDSSWSVRRTGIALGLTWSWLDRISVQGEAEGILEGVTAKKALYVSGASGDTSLSATDSRLTLGVELSHTLIPAWRDAVPKSVGFALRLGVAYQALSGLSLEPGWFNDANFGREPTPLYTSTPSLAQLGMLPSLGNHSTELSWTWGLGGWVLDRKLQADLAFSWNEWTPGTRADRTGLGWDAQLHYQI